MWQKSYDFSFKRIISLELVVKLEKDAESELHFVGNKAKGRIWKRVFQIRTYVCVSGGKKCWFFGKFGVLWDSVWDSPFCLITDGLFFMTFTETSFAVDAQGPRECPHYKKKLWEYNFMCEMALNLPKAKEWGKTSPHEGRLTLLSKKDG